MTLTETAPRHCDTHAHHWNSWLPDGHCDRCGLPLREVVAWDRHGQMLGIIPTREDDPR
ncbi:hypothetical protein ACFRAQ_02760 [Nocardia sp. NPDC056611]|uniref:hypothetical protein n=1 Tax=Nocardia sp. NPDC056611 TaxID=3345877 RepID=UPI00366F0776